MAEDVQEVRSDSWRLDEPRNRLVAVARMDAEEELGWLVSRRYWSMARSHLQHRRLMQVGLLCSSAGSLVVYC